MESTILPTAWTLTASVPLVEVGVTATPCPRNFQTFNANMAIYTTTILRSQVNIDGHWFTISHDI